MAGNYIPTKLEKALYDMCVDVCAHAQCDWQYDTKRGNGVNAAEAGEFARDVVALLPDKVRKDFDAAVDARAKVLREEYGG
jgi:hypothetical protein